MPKSKPRSSAPAPTTIPEHLVALPPDLRTELARVRAIVRKHLPYGYVEALRMGMLVYEVPLTRYPDTYNGQPLWYAALGTTKTGISLHLLNVYGDPALEKRLRDGFRAAGKKLNMGKACIRFKTADDLALDVVGELIASTPVETFVEMAKAARGG